mmetsp:Transcript_3512/g.13441  ORF Transcript_3512/g.13441 Transcript_3512/m.13441 type:complete len:403 (+) Transcript_3512:25-1233(+)
MPPHLIKSLPPHFTSNAKIHSVLHLLSPSRFHNIANFSTTHHQSTQFLSHVTKECPKNNSNLTIVDCLRRAMKVSNVFYPSQDDVDYLLKTWRMEAEQLNELIRTARDRLRREGVMVENTTENHQAMTQRIPKRKRISEETRVRLVEWVRNHSIDGKPPLPSNDEWRFLIRSTRLSKSHIARIFKYHSEQRGTVTEQIKEQIGHWVKQNQNPVNLTNEQVEELKSETGLSSQQIIRTVRHLSQPNANLTVARQILLSQWIQEHPRTIPSKDELLTLREGTSLSSRQILNFIRHRLETYGEVSDEKVQLIRKAWHSSSNMLTTTQRELLSKELNLSRKQISDTIRQIADPPGQVTEETKRIIREALKKGNAPLTNEQIRGLQLDTHLSRQQIRNQIRYMTNQN